MAAPSSPFPLQHSSILFGQEPVYRLLDEVFSEGTVGVNDGLVTQNGGGAMRVNVAAGSAVVSFDTPYGGKRQVVWTATESGPPGSPTTADNWISTFTAAHATLPRIDRVVLTVQDASLDATGQRRAVFQVVAGTATSGATLTNLTGAAAVPANSILLANVLVRAATTAILTADIDTTSTVRQRTRVGGGSVSGSPAYGIAQFTSAVSITAGSEGAAQTVVTAPAITFDGSTQVRVEFFFPYWSHSNASATGFFNLHDGTASIGFLGQHTFPAATTNYLGGTLERIFTPSGTLTLSVRSFTSGGTLTVGAGIGGVGANMPGLIRIIPA